MDIKQNIAAEQLIEKFEKYYQVLSFIGWTIGEVTILLWLKEKISLYEKNLLMEYFGKGIYEKFLTEDIKNGD